MRSSKRKTSRIAKLIARRNRQRYLAKRARRSLMEALEPRQMMTVQINNFGLLTDTGHSATDQVTSDPRLTGSVSFDGYGGYAQVQFDHTGDGTADGFSTISNSGGSFTYNPHSNGLSNTWSGELPLKYRGVQYDGYGSVVSTTAWTSFTYNVENPSLTNFRLTSDTGSSSTDKVTSDPRLQGNISWNGSGHVDIQFDHNSDSSYDGYASVWSSSGSFQYDPRSWGLASTFAGELPMRYRLLDFDAYGSLRYTTSWTNFTYTVELPRLNALLTGPSLVNDTGSSSSDKVTSDPRVGGSVSWTGSGHVDVQFDHNLDGTAEGYAGVWSSGQTFQYDPRNWGLASSYQGELPLRYRLKEFDSSGNLLFTGDWIAFTITLEPPRLNAAVNSLHLVLDDGVSATDKMTSDPRLTASITWSGSGHVDIQFDHQGDGSYDGYAGVWYSGATFTYDPRNSGLPASYSGELPLKYRTVEYDGYGSTLYTSSWASFPITLEPPHYNAAVANFRLLNDTGVSSSDKVTTDPQLTGHVSWTGPAGRVDVQFDHQGDGTVEGVASVHASGSSFNYNPRNWGLSSSYQGQLPLKYRLAEYDTYGGLVFTGNWVSFSYTLELPGLGATIADLHLLNDTGASSTDRVTIDPRLTGTIVWTGSGYVQLQFDHDNNGSSDGSVTSTTSGATVTYDPRSHGLPSGTTGNVPMRYRLAEFDGYGSLLRTGNWLSHAFTLEAAQVTASLSNLHLVSDTGGSATDRVTTDPRVTATVSWVGYGGNVAVQFDHNEDGVSNGSVTLANSGSSFVYDPRNFGLASTFVGTLPLRVRTVEYDSSGAAIVTSGWTPFVITVQAPTLDSELHDLRLVNDTGASPTDRVTTDPRLTGSITWSGAGSVTVEFDHNQDGGSNGSVAVTASGGTFTYDPREHGLPPTFSGALPLRWRFVERDLGNNVLSTTDWTTFELTVELIQADASLESLELFADTQTPGDGVTSDPRLTGAVTWEGYGAGILVQFDHNGDGAIDGQTTLNPDDSYLYTPQNLSYGVHTIAARPRFWNPAANQYENGEWSTIAFTFEAAPQPEVVALNLLEDTGAADGVTQNSSLMGHVSATGSTEGLSVELDLNHDGLSDATLVVNDARAFYYDALQLDYGEQTVQARTRRWDGVIGQQSYTDWHSLTFTLEASVIPTLASWELANDTGASSSDRITTDARLTGSAPDVGWEIEIDEQADGVVDALLTTGNDGSFEYSPQFAAYGLNTVRARVREWDSRLAGYRSGAWSTLTFTYEAAPVSAITGLRLANDDGASATDLTTGDPALLGSVNSEAGGTVWIEFDVDGNGQSDAEIIASTSGSFFYVPANLQPGAQTVAARARIWDRVSQDDRFGDWSTLSFSYQTPASALTISQLELVNDTANPGDGLTTNPEFRGTVSSPTANLTIDLDFDQDGVADATTAVNETSGAFGYDPSELPFGPVTVAARVRSTGQVVAIGPWKTLAFVHQAPSDGLPQVVDLVVLSETSGAAPGIKITGRILNDGIVSSLPVQIDLNGDGMADGITNTDSLGRFEFVSPALQHGAIPLGVRGGEYVGTQSAFVYGAWTSTTYQSPGIVSTSAAIDRLELLSDSGINSADRITANGSVVAYVSSQASQVIVEFDGNQDNTIDLSVTLTTTRYAIFQPAGLVSGEQVVRARTKVWDDGTQSYLVGPWTGLAFTLETQTNSAPLVIGLSLENDNGIANDDKITSTPIVVGRVTNEGAVDQLSVQVDVNSDGIADATLISNELGQFRFLGSSLDFGRNTLRFRAVESTTGGELTGEWASFEFVYESSASAGPTVEFLETLAGTGGDGPLLRGRMHNDGVVAYQAIEIDIDGNGVSDALTYTDVDGFFSYRLSELSVGTHAIEVRAREWNPNGSAGWGEWSEIAIEVGANLPTELRITSLLLENDTGADNDDRATADSQIYGTLAGDGDYESFTIEIDSNADGFVDAVTSSDEQGVFHIDLPNLTEGVNTVRARLVDGGWVTLRFVLAADPDSSAAQALLVQLDDPNFAEAQNAIDQAANSNAHSTATSQADADYQAAVNEAAIASASQQAAAQTAYTNAVDAANSAYQAAIATAQSQLSASLGSYQGDPTTFSYGGGGFAWPALNPDGTGPARPTDGEDAPTLQHTNAFDWGNNSTYLARVAAATQARDAAILANKQLRDAAVAQAEATYTSQKQAAEADKQAAMQQAFEDSQSASDSNPYDLQAAYTAHMLAVQAAADAFRAKEEAANQGYTAAMADAYGAQYQSAKAQAISSRDAKIAAANQAFQNAVEGQTMESTAYQQALATQRQAIANARYEFALDNVGIDHTAMEKIYKADRIRKEKIADADLVRMKKVSKEAEKVRMVPVLHDAWEKNKTSIANYHYLMDKADIDADYTRDIAAAEEARVVSTANANHDQVVGDQLATADFQNEIAQARYEVVSAWAAGNSTPGAAYQMTLATAALTRTQAVTSAQLSRVTSLATAILGEEEAGAEAKQDYLFGAADALRERLQDKATFTIQMKIQLQASKTQSNSNTGISQHTLSDGEAAAEIDYRKKDALAYEEHMNRLLDAWDIATVKHAAAQRDLETETISPASFTALSNAINKENQDSAAKSQETYSKKQGTLQQEKKNAIADALAKKYHDHAEDQKGLQTDTSDQLTQSDMRMAEIEADFQRDIGDVTFDLNTTIANAAKSRAYVGANEAQSAATTIANALKAEAHTSAGAEATYVNATTADFLAQVQTWANGLNTPWSQFQVSLAIAQKDLLLAELGAGTTYATTIADAYFANSITRATQEAALALTVADADFSLATQVAQKRKAATEAAANQSITHAEQIALKVKAHDKTVADANEKIDKAHTDKKKEHTKRVHDAQFVWLGSTAATTWRLATGAISFSQAAIENQNTQDIYNNAFANSVVTLANELADERVKWTDLVAPAKKKLVEELGKEIKDDAGKTAERALKLKKDETALLDVRLRAEINKKASTQKAIAQAGKTLADALANAVKTYADSSAIAAKANALAEANATSAYKNANAAVYANAMAAWDAIEDTTWSEYLLANANAEKTWTTSTTTAYVTYETALADAQKTFSDNTANDAKTRALAENTAQVTFVESRVDAESTEALAVVTASTKFQEKLADAVKTHVTALAGFDEAWNNSVAAATEAWEKETAGYGKTYVANAAPIKSNFIRFPSAPQSLRDSWQTQLQQKADARTASNRTAAITRATSRASALTTWVNAAGPADTAYATTATTELRTFATAQQTAANARATSIKAATDTLTGVLTTQASTAMTGYVGHVQTLETAIGTAAATQVTSLTTADVALTTATANAEKTKVVTDATNHAADLDAEADALNTLESRMAAYWAEAQRDWVTAVGPAIVTYRVALVQAAAASDQAMTTAGNALNTAYNTADVTFATAVAPAMKTRDDAIGTAMSIYGVKHVELQEKHKVTVVDAATAQIMVVAGLHATWSQALVAAKNALNVAEASHWGYGMSNWQQHQTALENARKAKDLADASAKHTYVVAAEGAQLTFSNAVATSAKNYTKDEAEANRTSVKAIAGITHTYEVALANADSARTKSRAKENVTYQKAQATAAKDSDVAAANAESALWTTQYGEAAAAMAAFASHYNYPYLDYLAALAAAENNAATTTAPMYVQYRTDVAEANKTAADNIADAYDTLWTTLADKQSAFDIKLADSAKTAAEKRSDAAYGYSVGIAQARFVQSQETANANKEYGVAVADADKQFVIDSQNEDMTAQEASDARAEAVSEATEIKQDSIASANEDFLVDRAAAWKTHHLAAAVATRDFAKATANAKRTYTLAAAPALKTYAIKQADENKMAAVTSAEADADYVRDSSQAYAQAMNQLAASSPAPWADYTAYMAAQWAAGRIVQADAYEVRQIAAAGYIRTQAVANATATAARDIAKANADRNQAVAAANTAYASAQTTANKAHENRATLTDPFVVVVAPVVDVQALQQQLGQQSLLGNRAAGEPADWQERYDSYVQTGASGDGYYGEALGEVVLNKQPNDSYTGWNASFNRFVGDRILRPTLGDEFLANMSDATMYTAVIGGSIAIVLGGYAFAAAAPGLASGAAYYGAISGAIGGAVGGLHEAVNTYVYHENMSMDWGSVAGGALTSAAFGAVLGPFGAWIGSLGAAATGTGSSILVAFGVVAAKSAATAFVSTGMEYVMATLQGDENFSFGGALLRNFVTDLAMAGINASGMGVRARATASTRRLALSLGANRATAKVVKDLGGYAAHYVYQVSASTALDTAWAVGVEGRDVNRAFTQSLTGNLAGQLTGDILSGDIKRRNPNLRHLPLCFVAGTLVQLGTPEGQDPRFTPIEQLKLGQRVQADHPLYGKRKVTEPEPATWRTVHLLARNDKGSEIELQLLRPLTWISAVGAKVGAEIFLEVSDLNIATAAKVLAITDCPVIETGPGSVITGEFRQLSNTLVDVHVEGLKDPIRCTAGHPFWSETRREFVGAGELHVGEQLAGWSGTRRVAAVIDLSFGNHVHNIEVQGEHVFRVSAAGILVHNSSDVEMKVVPRKGMTKQEVTDINGRRVTIYGQGSSSSQTAGHEETIVRTAREMAESGDYDYVLMQRSWRTSTNRIGTSGLVPDVIGVRRDGRVDAYEVQSMTDDRSVLRARLKIGMESLPEARRGDFDILASTPDSDV